MNPNPEPLLSETSGPLTGSQLNHYIFQLRIASTGGIEVYRAHDTKLNREVAIKVLPQLLSGRQRDVAQLYREAQVQASLNHPGIAAIYGIEEDEFTTGLVMELVGGDSLTRKFAQGPQPFEVTLEYARQIAEALEAGHERGVVHGDLKADNIMIAADGRLRILNFGVAGILAASNPNRNIGAEKENDIRAWGHIVCQLLSGHEISSQVDWPRIRKRVPKPFLELLRSAVDDDCSGKLQHISLARYQIDAIRNSARSDPQGPAWRRTAVIATAVSAALAFLFWRHQQSAPPSPALETASISIPAAASPTAPVAQAQPEVLAESSRTPDARVAVDFDYTGGVPAALGQPRVGDGGPATAAVLQPSCVAVDAEGRLYVTEVGPQNSRVRKVENGIITTVAGTGLAGFSGDGGPAVSAQLANPQGITVDKAGNLYIADFGNLRIRKVSPNGTIRTIAGTGQSGYNGDEIPATSANIYPPQGITLDSRGSLYFTESNTVISARVRKITPDGLIHTIAGGEKGGFAGDFGPAASATLMAPYGVAVDDDGNVYIADYGNVRVRKIDSSGMIQTVAGNGSRGFNGDGPAVLAGLSPVGVGLGRSGNLYIADLSRIRMLSPNGVLTTVAGDGNRGSDGDGGAALQAKIGTPRCVIADASGDLYLADNMGGRIRKVSAGIITAVVGGGRGQPPGTPALTGSRIYRVGYGNIVTAPQVLEQVLPSYTDQARAANVRGRVILEAIIRADGRAEITRVTQGLGHGLDESARSALQQWRFRPATLGITGPPVDVTLNIVVSFEPN